MASRRQLRAVTVVLLAVLSGTAVRAGFSGTDLFLPMAGRQAGVHPSNWYTTVWIHNPGAATATARIYFLERGTANPTPPWVDVTVAPGDTERIENIVEQLFHKLVFGALRVTCEAQELLVTSRVYSKAVGTGEEDSVGQDFAAVPASFAIGLGETSQILGAHQTVPAADSVVRFNFGFVETTGHTVTVRVRAFDGHNTDQGSMELRVREYSQRQVAFKDYFPTVSTENTRLEAEVISGAGRVIAYGSGIANGSQDPTTFEMSYPDSLLAANVPPGVGGSGSAGQVAFWSDAATLSGSSSLFWNSGAGFLGIGTSTPAEQLHLTGNLRLPATAAGGWAGVLYVQDTRFLHSYGPAAGAGNTFVGLGSGNFTMGGAGPNDGRENTATGSSSLASNTKGFYNTASGTSSLYSNTTGNENTAGGWSSLLLNTTGSYNTASGSASLYLNATGSYNTASGASSLLGNTTGSYNTATGGQSLYSNTTGSYNTATGGQSLASNTTGSYNTATGLQSLYFNTTGEGNSASGYESLFLNTTGTYNTASGNGSLRLNTIGSENTATGASSLFFNTKGESNTASGVESLYSNSTGSFNTASGGLSLWASTTGESNTAIGGAAGDSNVTGSRNTFLGADADASAGDLVNATAIGSGAIVDASNHVQIGNTIVTQIGGQVAWSNLSDARHKSSIRDLDLGRDLIMALRPVSYTVDGGDGRTDMGFLAQDVEALVGDGYSVLGVGADPDRTLSLRYTDLIAPLVKAVQEQQAQISAQEQTIRSQQVLIEDLLARVAALERSRE
jgi:trimeric autotransporter adhesin